MAIVAISPGRSGVRAPARRLATHPWVLRGLSIVVVLALWEWAGRVPVSIAFPTFTDTITAFAGMLTDGTFAAAYAETAGPLIVGVALTGLGGVVVGLVMGL